MTNIEMTAETLLLFGLLLAAVPVLLAMTTCFIKIGMIIGILRNAFGVQGVPGKMAEFALSVALTVFVMAPVWQALQRRAQALPAPVASDRGIDLAALEEVVVPWVEFLQRNTDERELAFVASLQPQSSSTQEPLVWTSVVPAFVLSELRRGFEMGFSVLLPFLVIDLVVANLLAGIGLSMMSPTLVAFPLKLLLFVACDGWMMITKGILLSYRMV